jgi:tetratricopeptide (TPR) repeat protein
VCEESAGNAFFVCELLDHLRTTGRLERLVTDGRGGLELPIPDSVRDVVGQQLARLSPEVVDVLTMAAVVGLSFDLELVATVVGLPPDEVLDLIEKVARVTLVNEVGVGRYAFSHAMVRTTLLDRMSATRRALAHARVAGAIEARGGGRHDELYHHWLMAGQEEKAFTNLALAATRDLQALAYESAATRFEQVLDFTARLAAADRHLEARAWLGVGLAHRALGSAEFLPAVQRAGRLARKLRDPDLTADSALASVFPGWFFTAAGRTEEWLIELCEDALDLLPPLDPRRVRIMSTLAVHLTFDRQRERRLDLLREAQRLARLDGEPELIGSTLSAEFIALWDPTTHDRRAEIAAQISRVARASGDAELTFLGGFFSAFCAFERGDVPVARERLAQVRPAVDASRNFYFRFLVDRLSVSLDLLTCAPGVQQAIDDLASRYSDTHADTSGTWALQTGVLAIQAGRLGSLADAIGTMISESALSTNWSAAWGLALLDRGDRDGAMAALDAFAEPAMDYLWLTTMQSLADLAIGLQRIDVCERVLDELMPFRGFVGVTSSGTGCYGLVSRTLGRLALATGRTELAVELLDEAVARADVIGAPFESTSSRRSLALALIACGERVAEVEGLVATALELSMRYGFAGEQRELARLSVPAG